MYSDEKNSETNADNDTDDKHSADPGGGFCRLASGQHGSGCREQRSVRQG